MRAGDRICRLRGEKIPYIAPYGRGYAFEYLDTRIPVNVLTETDGCNSHPFCHLFNR